jgi:hypothetical protein
LIALRGAHALHYEPSQRPMVLGDCCKCRRFKGTRGG